MQEAVYRILALPMKQLSRSVVFVDTNQNSCVEKQCITEDNDTNVFQKSLIDKAQATAVPCF